jgi:hypothetical protein
MAELAICKLQDSIMAAREGFVDASIGIAFFYGNMWEALGPSAAPSGLKTTCQMTSRWRLSLPPFVRGELR